VDEGKRLHGQQDIKSGILYWPWVTVWAGFKVMSGDYFLLTAGQHFKDKPSDPEGHVVESFLVAFGSVLPVRRLIS
jgi:hypothetical protein